MKAVERVFLVVAVAGCLLLLLLLLRAGQRAAASSGEIEKLQTANRELSERLKSAELERDTLRAAHQALAEAEKAEAAPARQRVATTPADAASRIELIRMLGENQQKLSAAQATIDDLNQGIAELESRVTQLTEQAKGLTRSETEMKVRLDTQTRLTSALQAELKSRSDRLLEIEVANRMLRQSGEEGSAKLAPVLEAAAEMEELSRRRESTLNNILRRYREVTDLYRNMTLQQPPGADVSRIQNAISLAEEDLKQLQVLNAQTSRAQRKLSAARNDALKR